MQTVGLALMRTHPPLLSLTAILLVIGGCSSQPPAPEPTAVAVVAAGPTDLSVRSTPVAGSTVAGPVNVLLLDFSAPVALGEVTVSGPDGLMPMMLSPAGIQTHYEVPLPALGSGSYTVAWKASLNGAPKSGNFAFTVK